MSRTRQRATRWFVMTPVGAETKNFLSFALSEAQEARRWTREQVELGKVPEGKPEWQAAQLRRRYLAGQVVLHTIPGSIFEEAILESLLLAQTGEIPSVDEFNTITLRCRDGWTGERGDGGEQKFSFSGEPRKVVRGSENARLATPEKAENDLFEEHKLVWKWGTLRIGGNVEEAAKSTFHHWHLPWRGRENFFRAVKHFEVRESSGKWELRIIFK